MKISINQILKNSPALPPAKETNSLKDSKKDNLYQVNIKNKKAVIRSTMIKMIYSDDFWREALDNDFFEDYTDKQNLGNSKYLSKPYEWSNEVIVAFWSLVVGYQYYKRVDIRGTEKIYSIESLYRTVLDSDILLGKNSQSKRNNIFNHGKAYIVRLSSNNQFVLDEVKDKMITISNFLVNNRGELDWYDFFEQNKFTNDYNTALINNLKKMGRWLMPILLKELLIKIKLNRIF